MKTQKQGLMEHFKRRKYKLNNHKTLEMEHLRRKRYNQKYHRTLEEGVRKKNNQREFRNGKRWRLLQHQKKRYPRYNIQKQNHELNQWGRRLELQSKTQIQNHQFLCRLGLQNCSKGSKCLKGYKILSFYFCHFTKISRMEFKV